MKPSQCLCTLPQFYRREKDDAANNKTAAAAACSDAVLQPSRYFGGKTIINEIYVDDSYSSVQFASRRK